MISSDYRGIRYTFDQFDGVYGTLHVPLFDQTIPNVREEAIKFFILDLAVHSKPKRELLEHRMGKVHREWIKELAGTRLRVLEYGCGASTLWYREQGMNVITVEHDPVWAAIIGGVTLFPMPKWPTRAKDAETGGGDGAIITEPIDDYVRCPRLGKFDIILVDGILRNACLRWAHRLLTNHGIVLLHDAQRDWYELGRKDYWKRRELPECEDYKGPTLWAGTPL
jgi:SAM-dependent methyltransferase